MKNQKRCCYSALCALAAAMLAGCGPAEQQAAASLQRAQAALERAKVQTARFKPLVEAAAISRQLDLKFAAVEAPIAGRIDQALVTEGALVSSGDSQPTARIQPIDPIYVDVRQPAASLESLRGALATQPEASGNGLSRWFDIA